MNKHKDRATLKKFTLHLKRNAKHMERKTFQSFLLLYSVIVRTPKNSWANTKIFLNFIFRASNQVILLYREEKYPGQRS